MDRNMMLTPDEYMSLMRLIRSERESEGASLSQRTQPAASADKPKRKRKSAYQRRYEKNFKSIEDEYKLKSGRWKKNGFKRAVKQAHKMSKM